MKRFLSAGLLSLFLGALNLCAQNSPSSFGDQFKGHLIALDKGTPKDFDTAALKGVKYWAFYYSASWCPPCRVFTPKLTAFYQEFKKTHPNFELILVGADANEEKMEAYMKKDAMPWPAIKFADLDSPDITVKKYAGPGIPDLVLTDENGKVLSDSFHGENYVGPAKVMEDIKTMVPMPKGA